MRYASAILHISHEVCITRTYNHLRCCLQDRLVMLGGVLLISGAIGGWVLAKRLHEHAAGPSRVNFASRVNLTIIRQPDQPTLRALPYLESRKIVPLALP